ncbi:acyltransferase family protein [Actinophytocola glycyrrhizae]|uniref:Acyltransferase family protein n=1 Tax=Actinophytocola glycyrrhizae TaxID=2044873 RepID=A0ABV9S2A3_9PSEU
METVTAHRPGDDAPTERLPAVPARPGFRPDIQALRAVAVLAVVVNHLSANWLTGGYVGVDVFFVISGFLISSHLDREITGTGRVRLGRFYARRIRRLLPAALLVLGLSLAAAYFLLPYPRWAATANEAAASAMYWENWLLAAKSVDYSAASEAASLAQHYWSLSVEEQFYLVWPLLLLLLFKVRRRRAQVVGIAAVGAASLAFSVYYTEASPNEAYFVTHGRAWEFAAGALVALLASRLMLPRAAAGLASFAGFAMIIAAAVLYDHHTPFPGYLALVPTVGTALVIVGGLRPGRQWHSPVTGSWPVQAIGNFSYSLYLWHWPLILLAPFVLGDLLDAGEMTTPYLLGVLAVSLVLASLSKRLVEDRGMSFGPLARSTKLTFVAMVAVVAAIAVAAGALERAYDDEVATAERKAEQVMKDPEVMANPCHGAPAMIRENKCADPFGPAEIVTMGPANEYYDTPEEECEALDEYKVGSKKTTTVCDFSRGAKAAPVVWLVGDSHAQQWQGPLFDLAREHRWVLKLALLGGCPFADVEFTGYRTVASEANRRACTDWTANMADVVTDDRPMMVFVSFFARAENADDGSGRSQTDQYRDGLEPYWRKWTGAGAKVFVLADPPLNGGVRARDCVVLNPDDPLACAVDREVAHPGDPLTEVARRPRVPGVTLVDMTDYFCDDRRCYAVVGNVAVYFDHDHMNLEFSRSMKPMIAEAIGLR